MAGSGDQYNVGYQPYNDTFQYLNTGYYYQGGKTKTGPIGDVNITFSTPVKYYGLYWGLINASNTIKFYDVNNNQLSITSTSAGNVITGQDLKNRDSTITLDGSGTNGSKYVDFFAEPGESISKVVLPEASSSSGFETDNHAYKVPFGFSPGLGILTLGALGAIGQIKSRVQKLKSSEKIAINE